MLHSILYPDIPKEEDVVKSWPMVEFQRGAEEAAVDVSTDLTGVVPRQWVHSCEVPFQGCGRCV